MSTPPTATNVAVAAGVGGTPAAIVTVLLWQQYTGHPLGAVEACAVGSVGASVFGFAWHVITTIVNRNLERWS